MRSSALAFATLSGCLLFAACSQSGQSVLVHSYGVNVSSPSLGMHTFRSGDTLWSVAQRYDVDLRDLLEINRLKPPYAIASGTRVRIPAPRSYDVRSGDTLYNISRLFNSTTTEIARLNRLPAPYKVSVGQKLRIPATSGKSAAYANNRITGPVAVPSSKPAWFGESPQTQAARGGQSSQQASRSSSIQSEVLPPVAGRSPDPVTVSSVPVPAPVPAPEIPQAAKDAPLPPLSGSGFIAPVSGPVLSAYGVKPDGLHNDGINIKAARGTSVRASESGTVAYVGDAIEGYGKLILIRHRNGYITAYAHLDKILVKKGAAIKRGEAIGTVGSTGRVTTPQLHFEIRKGKDALDPARYIRI